MHVDLLTSSIWQTNSTILSHHGTCVVVDPGYFPREIDAIATHVRELGRAEAVVFTHGHWDHVMGHTAFPDVPVWVNRELKAAIADDSAAAGGRSLERAHDFDSRWYIDRSDASGYRWPHDLRALDDGDRVELGGIATRALHLPGHSPDGLGLIVEQSGLFIVGDHLSPCEIPFVDDVVAYRGTLTRLIDLLRTDVRDVIPGHGPRLTADEAIEIGRADLEYLDRLFDAVSRGDVDGARSIPLPRAVGCRRNG